MRKSILTICLLAIMSIPCFANDCPDVKDAASTAIEQRNQRTTDVQNAAMADPEADRDDIFS